MAEPANFSFTGILRITRVPNLLIIALTQYFVAVFLIRPHASWFDTLVDPYLFLLMVSTLLIAAAGYIINDYYDVKIDLINRPDTVVVGKVIKRRVIMLMHGFLNFVAIIIGAFLGWKVLAIHIASAILLWLYSNLLKRKPFVGNLAIAILTGLSIVVVPVLFEKSRLLILVYAYLAGALTLIREIIKDMEDVKGDEIHGSATLPIVFGIRRTKNFLFIVIGLFILSIFYFVFHVQELILTIYFMLLATPFFYFILRLVRADAKGHFTFLSLYTKLMMLSGVLSMSFF